jgi:hypothetical protein
VKSSKGLQAIRRDQGSSVLAVMISSDMSDLITVRCHASARRGTADRHDPFSEIGRRNTTFYQIPQIAIQIFKYGDRSISFLLRFSLELYSQ